MEEDDAWGFSHKSTYVLANGGAGEWPAFNFFSWQQIDRIAMRKLRHKMTNIGALTVLIF